MTALSSKPRSSGKRQDVHLSRSAQRQRRSVKIASPPDRGAIIVVQTNPAVLSATLRALLPAGAVITELRSPGDTQLLLPAEARFLGRSVPKRAQEFAAGRLCARRALAEFGIGDFAIEMAADRRPLWPQSMVGSITHTDDFCAAVVAERASLAAVGIDSEGAARVKPELWRAICVTQEIEWLSSLPETERAAAASLIFSAKEAFYKCQYPLTEQFLGFRDAHVQVTTWGEARGKFEISATREIAFAAHASLPMVGKYVFHEQFVTAALWVAASAAANVIDAQ